MRTGGRESEEGAHGRTDTASVTPSRGWRKGERDLSGVRNQRRNFLYLGRSTLDWGSASCANCGRLREENGKLKRLVADLSLDRHILQEIVQKKL